MWLNANHDESARVACPAVVFRGVDLPSPLPPETWRRRNTTLLERTTVEASAGAT